MKIFVYCGEGIGHICDSTDEVDFEEFPYSYLIKEEKESNDTIRETSSIST